MTTGDDALRFKDDAGAPAPEGAPWKVLVVDDDEEVHAVTRLALTDFRAHGRALHFLHAYTGDEAVRIMGEQADVAVILMDVVMETEHAGLEAVEAIRKDLNNRRVRIVVRTGQPGQAPEAEVVSKFDINGYKRKTELTTRELHAVILEGIARYCEPHLSGS